MKKSLRSIGNIANRITAPLLGKQGHVLGAIVHDWSKIVGDNIVSLAIPQKIVFRQEKRSEGTLHLLVTSGAGPLIQQISPMIIERVNTYFGYSAVLALKIHQGFIPAQKRGDAQPMALDLKEEAWLDATIAPIEPGDLHSALENFGKSLLCDQKKTKK